MSDLRRFLDVTRLGLGKSIQAKLAALFSIVFAIIAVILNIYLPQKFERQASDELDARGRATANLAAYAVQPGLRADDRDLLEDALGAIMNSSAIEYVAATDLRGRVLASAGALDAAFDGPLDREGLIRRGSVRAHVTMVEIPSESGPIGRITLAVSAAPFEAAHREGQWTAAIMSMSILVFGLLAVAVISVNFTRPLVAMVGTAERIASGDLAHRATEGGEDQVGQLAAAFNRMVDRVQAGQKAVRDSNARFRRILDHLPVEVALLDPDGRFVYVNPAGPADAETRDVVGSTTEEVWESRDVDYRCDLSPAEAVQRCVASRETVHSTVRLRMPDGDERHLIRGYSPVFATSGAARQVIAFGIDVTDRIAAETALRESEAKLMQAAKMESIGRLAGGVAHDFNNLLTAILGHCEILRMDMAENDPNRDSAEEITRAAERAAELTRRLLTFSRKQDTRLVPLNLNDIVSDMERMLERLIGHEVRLDFRPGDSIVPILADATQVEQVVLNLAVNARDAMPDGGSLVIETREVEVGDDVVGATGKLEPGAYVQLEVSDSGVGIDEETLALIFDPFYTSKGPTEGTGLGLATVFGIVKAGGGTITVSSEPGEGTTFRVYFPSADGQSGQEPKADVESNADLADLRGHENVLIVEDQASVMRAAQNILERQGYRVRCTTSAADALDFAQRSKDPIHLLLTDVMMPDMTGPELADAIGFVSPDTEVLFMSGYTGDALKRRGVLESEVRLVEKPFVAAELCRAVREALDVPRTAREFDWSEGPDRLVGPRPAD